MDSNLNTDYLKEKQLILTHLGSITNAHKHPSPRTAQRLRQEKEAKRESIALPPPPYEKERMRVIGKRSHFPPIVYINGKWQNIKILEIVYNLFTNLGGLQINDHGRGGRASDRSTDLYGISEAFFIIRGRGKFFRKISGISVRTGIRTLCMCRICRYSSRI